MTPAVVVLTVVGFVSNTTAFGILVALLRALDRRVVALEKRQAHAEGVIIDLQKRLLALETGAHAEQMRQLVEEALVKARGWRAIAEETRAELEAYRREHEGNGSSPYAKAGG